jgi:histidinol-phosphate aminotransferase
VADPEVVQACEAVVLPYHLSAQTQLAGLLALDYTDEMEARVALISEERGRVAAALGDLPVESWPSDANFILFRPLHHDADQVWDGLLARSVLIRNCASWDGLGGCLRVTIGRPDENDRFLTALEECLR